MKTLLNFITLVKTHSRKILLYSDYLIRIYTVPILFSVLMSFLISCEKSDVQSNKGELFWVDAGISKMPVFISGNSQSNTILLIIHGGPGGSSIDYVSGFEKNLGKDYQLAAWDQRYSGFSKFDISTQPLSMTIESNLQDCDAVVNFLQSKFPNKRIVIWGQSWGGAIVSGYASHIVYNNKIAGWIVVNGTVSGYEYHRSNWEFAVRRCNEKIQEGFVQYQDSITWLNNNTFDTNEVFNRNKLLRIIALASSLYYEGEPDDPSTIEATQRRKEIFPRPEDLNRYKRNYELSVNEISTSSEMFNWRVDVNPISKKGLLIWGEKDETCPIELLNWYSNLLTSNNKNHKVKIYSNAWHTPFISNQEQHDADVKKFINGL